MKGEIRRTKKEVREDPLFKKLEDIIRPEGSTNWYKNNELQKEVFHIYCEGVKYEAKLFDPKFIRGKEYKFLLKMDNKKLEEYLLKLDTTSLKF